MFLISLGAPYEELEHRHGRSKESNLLYAVLKSKEAGVVTEDQSIDQRIA